MAVDCVKHPGEEHAEDGAGEEGGEDRHFLPANVDRRPHEEACRHNDERHETFTKIKQFSPWIRSSWQVFSELTPLLNFEFYHSSNMLKGLGHMFDHSVTMMCKARDNGVHKM